MNKQLTLTHKQQELLCIFVATLVRSSRLLTPITGCACLPSFNDKEILIVISSQSAVWFMRYDIGKELITHGVTYGLLSTDGVYPKLAQAVEQFVERLQTYVGSTDASDAEFVASAMDSFSA